MDGGASTSSRTSSTLDDLMKEAKEQGQWKDHCKGLLDRGEHSLLRDILIHSLEQQEVINKRSLQALKDDSRPLSNRTASKPHVEKLKHPLATIKRVDDYDFDDDIKVPYGAPYVPRDSSVDSETDVQTFIRGVLESISGSFSKEVYFTQNRRIAGVKCDILLLYGKNRIPFAAVEIKKNGGGELCAGDLRRRFFCGNNIEG